MVSPGNAGKARLRSNRRAGSSSCGAAGAPCTGVGGLDGVLCLSPTTLLACEAKRHLGSLPRLHRGHPRRTILRGRREMRSPPAAFLVFFRCPPPRRDALPSVPVGARPDRFRDAQGWDERSGSRGGVGGR